MIRRRALPRRLRTTLIAALIVPALGAGAGTAYGAPPPTGGITHGAPVLAPVAPVKQASAAPLPSRRPAPVPLDRSRTIRRTGTAAVPTAGALAPSAAPPSAAPQTAAPQAAAPVANKAGVRALIIAQDTNDFGLATWKSVLDRTGAAYDVLLSKSTTFTSDSLLRPDGAGRYNAVLLTDAMQLYQDGTGNFVSALSADEWNTLWAYERTFGVRQATLYASYGTFPEDYCLRAGSEGGTGAATLNATLTAAGAAVFDDLKSSAQIPITQSYVYQDTVAAGCSAQPVLTVGSAVLGVTSTSTDGRQRIALTFSSNQYLMQSDLLVYGLFRWASRGIFLGETRHFLDVDVDDWFNTSDEELSNGTFTTWQMTAHDAYNATTQQNALHTAYPLSSAFQFGMAYNGSDAVLPSGATCSPNGGVAQLTATTRCIENKVRWINHTYDHPAMDATDYPTSLSEIKQNITVANQLGLPINPTVLKTGAYSGLGTYNPNPNDQVGPPTDFGLAAANPNLLQAAYDAGVKFLHGNMSFASQVPACFDCATPFPKPTDNPPGPNVPENVRAALNIVPDWPTNIAYFSTTPDEETYFYNSYYGPAGKFPYFTTNQTYAQVIGNEATVAMSHIATGSLYTHTLHIGNLRDYGSGKTLASDWLAATLAQYSALYSVPLLSPNGLVLANYAVDRNTHFATLAAGVDAVYDSTAKTVTVTSPVAGKVTMSGARTAGFSTYGSEVSAPIALAAATPVTFTPTVRP